MSSVTAPLPSLEAGLPRLLAGLRPDGLPVGLEHHLALYGPLPTATGLIELIAASGLRGRGGGGFPTGRKLAAVASGRRRAVVVANGAEGEPVSFKDKTLLRRVPHLVLDGTALAAAAVGAREAFVAVDCQAREELEAVSRALDERRRW
jgi:NADH:ubiquinone oxidoreductase subunit F (NADH-binding)